MSKDSDIEKSNTLNAQLRQARSQHAALVETEKNVAGTIENKGSNGSGGNGVTHVPALTVLHDQRAPGVAAPIIIKSRKKELDSLDLLVRAGTTAYVSKIWNTPQNETRIKIYGEDEATKVVHEWATRAASAPAMTTVTGWAAELVQQVYYDVMALLMPKSVYPRLSAKGLTLNFGRAGKIIVPTRSRTPTLAGSFVGEGMAIPVRQGAFTSQQFTPKKMAVITVWTREMDEHSIPAIEGVLREAIQEDTAVAIELGAARRESGDDNSSSRHSQWHRGADSNGGWRHPGDHRRSQVARRCAHDRDLRQHSPAGVADESE